MVPLIRSNQLSETWTHFGLVAVIVGMEDMRPVVWSDGREALVRTLYLQDGSGEQTVELSLWDNDCVRTSALRVLDIVHVTEAGKMARTRPDARANGDSRTVPEPNMRISLRGSTAAVRLVADAVASAPCDEVSRAASAAKSWRDVRFKVVSSMRRRGALWTHDSPGHGRRPRRPRTLAPVVDDVIKGKPNNLQRKSCERAIAPSETAGRLGERVLLDDVRRGRCPAAAEVSNVCVSHVLVQTPRMQYAVSGPLATARALQAGCSRVCATCGHAEKASVRKSEETRELCRKCGGEITWRFGSIMVVLKDESCEVVSVVAADDVAHLLLGVQASALKQDQRCADWCASVLHALAADTGPFTVLVAALTDEAEHHGADVLLKRLYV